MKSGNINFLGAISTNNGIREKIATDSPYKANCISVNYNGSVGYSFYQEEPFWASDDVNICYANGWEMNRERALYLCSALQKHSQQYSYTQKWTVERMKNSFILLPFTQKKEIAFGYMERVIRELEEERIRELTAYLKASGLESTELTETEKSAVQRLRNGEIKWNEFKICGDDGIFEINNTHNILKSQIDSYCGDYPYCTAREGNNSIVAYVDYDKSQIEKGNSIFIGGKSLVITYQESDYFSNDSHNIACYVKDKNGTSRNAQLFMVSAMYKSLKPLYTWNDSISKEKIQKDKFNLPVTPSGSIDWDFMESLIIAETRLAIRSVIEWKDKVITKTREIVTA